MEVVIIGTGGLAKEIWGMLRSMDVAVLGFVAKDNGGKGEFMGLPVLGNDEWLAGQKGLSAVIANGNPATRRAIFERFQGCPIHWPSFAHPQAVVFDNVTWRGGCVIMPGGVIQPDVKIGFGCHINMGVTIGHDVTIGDFCVINHNAGISGYINICDDVLIGAGSTLIENKDVGKAAIVGAGAVATKNVPAGEVWVGIQARPIERHHEATYELYGMGQ